MPSFGEKLKAEREKRSITLDQISLSTKIGTRMLQALEEDKFSQLPGGIFNKGFVRAYARYVGIDEDQAVSDYLEAAGETPRPRVEGESEGAAPRITLSEDATHEFRSSAKSSRELPWGLFAAALLVIALGLSLWSHHRQAAAPVVTPAAEQNSAATPATKVPSPISGTSNPENAVSAKVPKAAADARATPSNAAAPKAAAAGKSASAEKTSPSAKTPQTAGASLPNAPSGEFTVLIQGREDCWISITADGKTLASYMLSAGEQRAVRGRQQVTIRAGNVGGLDLLFNGKKLASQGESGQVKTLTFGREGLQPTAQSPAVTQ